MANDRLHAILRHVRRTAAPAVGATLTDAQLLDRYLTHRDESAFGALVRRHGGLVASACRRILTDEADVEDAFQATFLVLLRKADSIRNRATLACWLYRVAGRMAVEARAARDRRRRVEQQPAAPRVASPPDPSWRDVCELLHAELDRLPPNLRLPLILCYLDGKTRDDAARQLGWSVSTLRGRLERGRARLRGRLARRGVDLSAALLATAAASRADAVGPALVRSVVELARGLSPSAAVTALATGAMRVAIGAPAAIAVGLVIVAGLCVGVGAAGRGPLAPPAKPQAALNVPPQAALDIPPRVADDTIAYSGRVLGPDGKPVAGAKVYLAPWWGYHYEPFTSPESATTGADGRFAFTTSKAKQPINATSVSAMAPKLGIGWVGILKDEKRTDLTLQLVADDVPITGQIVDLEGKPVPGATLRVLQVMASPKEDLGRWLDAAKDKTAPPRGRATAIEQEYLTRYVTAPSPVVTTDAAGRFRLTGIGRERLVIAQLDGPTITSEHLRIRTRPGEIIKVGDQEADPEYGQPRIDETYYGADFRHAAGPTKPIVGVVRDKDSKKPLAGVTVRSEKLANNPLNGRHFIQTKTDADGRYRLVGMPKGAGNRINIVPPDDMPYLSPVMDVPDSYGLAPVTVDVDLKRGVWIEGKITDKVTGQPIRGSISYIVRNGNPNLRDYPGFWGGIEHLKATNDDGTYRVIGLPGLGQILVFRNDGYLLGAERDDEDGLHEAFGHVPASNFGAFARIDPAKGTESLKRDIALVPGWTFTGTILGPDGKPLVGAVMAGQREKEMKTAEFAVRDFNPRRPRCLIFRHLEKGLVGIVPLPKENGGSVTVPMTPGATVTGRLVDADGMPRVGVELFVSFQPKGEPHWDAIGLAERPTPDREGRFRITALLPDLDYELFADHNTIKSGAGLQPSETKDLGDVRFKP